MSNIDNIDRCNWDNSAIEQGNLFKSLIVLNRCKTIVEIGVAFAATTKYLCEAANIIQGNVYGYDIWEIHGLNKQFIQLSSKEYCEKYLTNHGFNNFQLTKINSKTEEFKNLINKNHKEIDFCFIDGCHSYLGIKNDFDVIYPLLSSTGIIAFHDTLRIDGCREFIIDLRTKYNDGTFDIVDFPFGSGPRRVGITLLVKRSFATDNLKIDETCGSISSSEEIYLKEKEWYKEQVKH